MTSVTTASRLVAAWPNRGPSPLDDLKAISVQHQITLHTCRQGWTGIAKWSGIRLRHVRAQVEPLEDANYVMVESFGAAQQMHDGRPVEPYYTVLAKHMAMRTRPSWPGA